MVVTSNIKATFPCDSQRVFEVVTSLTNYSWRSDIERIEVISDTQFVEITKSGYRTIFTITRQEPFCLWEFDIENDNMKGHWVGAFSGNEKTTTIDFTEHIEPKKWFPKLLVRIYFEVYASQICQGFEAGVEDNVIIDFGSKVEKLCHK